MRRTDRGPSGSGGTSRITFSSKSAIKPCPFGGHSCTARPRKSLEIGGHVLARCTGEVRHRVQSAARAQLGDHLARELTFVEGDPPLAGDRLERVGELGQTVQAADGRPSRPEASRYIPAARSIPRR